MSAEPVDPRLPELLAHGRFLRALALKILCDAHEAEDVVQEAYLAALRQERRPAKLRPWLAAVTRNLSHKRRRQRSRAAPADGETAFPSAAETAEQLELQERIVRAVRALDEPYRRAVMLRFYYDRSASEMAAELGVPVETVRTRVRRALATLRGRLDREHGGDRSAWIAGLTTFVAAGAATPAAAAVTATGAVVMVSKVKSVAIAALLVAALFSVWKVASDVPANPEISRAGVSSEMTDSVSAIAARAEAAEPTVAGGGAALTVLVRKPRGEPAAGVRVEVSLEERGSTWWKRRLALAAPRSPLGRAITGADGSARLTDLPDGRYHVVAAADGFARGSASGARGFVTILLEPACRLQGQVLDERGRPAAGAIVLAGGGEMILRSQGAALPQRTTSDAAGRYRFEALPPGRTTLWLAWTGAAPFCAATIRVPDLDEYDLTLPRPGRIAGTVRDDGTGAPLAGARVAVHGRLRSHALYAEATTDAAGRDRIDSLPACDAGSVRATLEGYVPVADVAGAVRLATGAVTVRDLRLRRGAALFGRVRRGDEPLAAADVVADFLDSSGGLARYHAASDREGRYRFAGLPRGECVLYVKRHGALLQKEVPVDPARSLRERSVPPEFLVVMPPEGELEREIVVEQESAARGAVAGRVIGPGDRPIAGAVVAAGGARGTTDAAGDFLFEGVRAGKSWLWVRAAGVVQCEWAAIDVPEGGHVRGAVIRMRTPARLTGRVDAAGEALFVQTAQEPAPHDRRRLGHLAAWWLRWAESEPHPVARDGTYDIALPFARGVLYVRAIDALDRGGPAVRIEITPEGDRYRADLAVPRAEELRGVVLDAGGDPVAGVRIAFDRSADDGVESDLTRVPVRAVTGGDGRFLAGGLEPGRWLVRAWRTGWLTAQQAIELPATDPLRIELTRAGELAGVVVSPSGEPLAGVQVHLRRLEKNGWRGEGGTRLTDVRGGFRIPELPADRYRVVVSAARTGPNIQTTISPVVRPNAAPLRLVAEPGYSIAGRVEGEQRRGILGARVRVTSAGGSPRTARTALDGSFEVRGVGAGSHCVSVSLTGTRESGDATTLRQEAESGSRDLRFRFRDIGGRLRDASGRRPWVLARDATGTWKGARRARIDGEGRFRIRGLPPGDYRLLVREEGGVERETTKVRVAAGSLDVELDVVEGERITGRVATPDGRPLPRAHVGVVGGPGTRSDAEGRFELRGLAADGAYVVVARLQGRLPAERKDVRSGADVTLLLAPGLRTTGTLRDDAGRPLAHTWIQLLPKSGSRAFAYAQTGADGRFDVAGLERGEYELRRGVRRGRRDLRYDGPPRTVAAGARDLDVRIATK